MSTNIKDKTTLILCDLSKDTGKEDIESFLSQYKDKITSIQFNDKKSYKATVIFNDYTSANECRINMNQKKLKNKAIRIMWEEKDFLLKNKDYKNNLYIKGIPKNKSAREVFEYFHEFGDIFSIKLNEDDKGNSNGTAFVTYYNQGDAKKAMDETNGKKIWGSDMDVQYQKINEKYHNNNNDNNLKVNISNLPEKYTDKDITKLCEEFGKIQIVNINKGPKGKHAIVKFSNEQEVKNAVEKLNNKEIENKKLYEFYCDYGNYLLEIKDKINPKIIEIFTKGYENGHTFCNIGLYHSIITYYDFYEIMNNYDKAEILLDCLLDYIVFKKMMLSQFILLMGYLIKYSKFSKKIISLDLPHLLYMGYFLHKDFYFLMYLQISS
jgi:RNA recognition motif-containing protein